MSAPWTPSLDALLADATPVETPPFDLGAALVDVASTTRAGVVFAATDAIARYVNGLRCDIESARSKAVKLENENAEQTDRIAEALNWLAVAATFSTSEDCSAAIDDARAALEVTS